jgi:hypothetical protein
VEVTDAEPERGDVVVYRNDDQICHAGIVQDGRIVSKWGGGHVWRHGLFEVPSSYGRGAQFFKALPAGVALAVFEIYVRETLGEAAVS